MRWYVHISPKFYGVPYTNRSTVLQDGKSLRRLTCADCGEDHVDPPTTNDNTNNNNNNNTKSPSRPVPISSASFLVNDDNRKEVRSLDEDLAIVSPLIDGRLRDVAVDEA